MRIVGFRIDTVANDLKGRVWNPRIRWEVKHAVFVTLLTSEGRRGLGECWCFDTAPDALIAFLRTEVAPNILGLNAAEARQALEEMTRRATLTARHGILASALSGVDLALWDITAQDKGVPLWQAIDPRGTGVAEFYASGGLYTADRSLDSLADELARYTAQGFTTVKMKIGGLSQAEDAARVAAARARLGPEVGLIVDGVYSYTTDGAAQMFDRIRHLDIRAFQSPTLPENLEGMRRLCREGIPVMGIEAEYREELLAELLEGRAVSILQVAPVACGGPSRVLALAERARAAGIPMSLETSSTAVATLAAAHLAAARAEIRDVEYHMIHQVFFDRWPRENGTFVPSRWRLPNRAGLGIELDPRRVTPGPEIAVDAVARKEEAASN